MITSTQAKKIATLAALDAMIGRCAGNVAVDPPQTQMELKAVKNDLGQLANIVRQLVAQSGPKVNMS